ncbi:hypothetical protein ACIBF5_25305 [Micromonospora sp. NPDC050417]|uniref:hypothetical protein n=1 Tax=Micromonospora sp. NPDC050417 TaxID=3364280 RepID=UPI0037AEBC8E
MAEIADVRLFKTSLDFGRFPDESNAMTWQLEMTPSVSYEDGDDFFILEIEYEVVIQELLDTANPDNSETSDLARLSFKLGSLYRVEAGDRVAPQPSELESYARTTGTLSLYPYAREFVQSMTARMGFPPLTLAPFRLPYPDVSTAPAEPVRPKRSGSQTPRKRSSR